jgi:hypothetical protein
MFEDQTVDLLPERTTMRALLRGGNGGTGIGGNGGNGGFGGIVIAVNAGNINFGSGTQINNAFGWAIGGNGGSGNGGNGGSILNPLHR